MLSEEALRFGKVGINSDRSHTPRLSHSLIVNPLSLSLFPPFLSLALSLCLSFCSPSPLLFTLTHIHGRSLFYLSLSLCILFALSNSLLSLSLSPLSTNPDLLNSLHLFPCIPGWRCEGL